MAFEPITPAVHYPPLQDDRTGVYWAADAFATPLPGPMDDIRELDPAAWQGGLEMFNTWNSPWCKLLDPAKFERHVERVQGLDLEVLASCHSPVIRRAQIDQAFSLIRKVPYATVPDLPGETDLEALKYALAAGQEYARRPPAPGEGLEVTAGPKEGEFINHKSNCPSTQGPCCTNRAGILCTGDAPERCNSLPPKE